MTNIPLKCPSLYVDDYTLTTVAFIGQIIAVNSAVAELVEAHTLSSRAAWPLSGGAGDAWVRGLRLRRRGCRRAAFFVRTVRAIVLPVAAQPLVYARSVQALELVRLAGYVKKKTKEWGLCG